MVKAKIGFVLLSSRQHPIPSTRISVLNMIPYLRAVNFETHILFETATASEYPHLSGVAERAEALGIDIVYFQKVRGPSVVETVHCLAARGIKTVFGVCDVIDNEMAEATDATVVVTNYLRSLYNEHLHHKIFVVHDGIENPDICVERYRPDRGTRVKPLDAVLVTSAELTTIPVLERSPPHVRINVVGNYDKYPFFQTVRRNYWRYREQATRDKKQKFLRNLFWRGFIQTKWDLDTVNEIMATSDIGIIPVDMSWDPIPGCTVSSWEVKSENRLTMKMAMGLPVIACPVPSYKEIIVQGENGYLAESREEWQFYIEELRDPDRRRQMGRQARECALQRYSKSEQAKKLTGVFESLRR